MKTFLIVLTVATLAFAAWASEQIAEMLTTDPMIVLIGALVLLGIVVAFVLLKPREPELTAAERDPRGWLESLHDDSSRRGHHGKSLREANVSERVHTDGRGMTWWRNVDGDGRETWTHESHGENIAANDERLRKL